MEANSASLGKKQCDETQQVGLVVRKPTVHKTDKFLQRNPAQKEFEGNLTDQVILRS